MTQTAKTSKNVKTQIVARYFIKRNGHIVYAVRSSNGKDLYHTTIINGKATGCTCPSYKPCYHMTQLEEIEAERNTQATSALCEWLSGFAAALQSKQGHLAGYDVVGAALQVFNQTETTHQIGDAYELIAAVKLASRVEQSESCTYCWRMTKHLICSVCAGV